LNLTLEFATPASQFLKGIIMVIPPLQNTSGTVQLLQQSPTIFAPVGSNTASGTATLLQQSPTFLVPTVEIETPKWTNTNKNPALNVTNADKTA
jgi:hypothetical protein